MPSPAPTPRGGDAPVRIVYEPGLDGLRAVALLAIFVVHADVGLASGGFLAVSTFFTLSGFLITSLLLIEHERAGRIGLRAFWIRRARRLLPAALIAIAGISVTTTLFGTAGQIARLWGDALASTAYVANWRFILVGDRYGAGFEGEPTLLHFWSLAIEEQFYVLFPLLCTVAFAWARRWRPATALVLLAGVIGSLLAGIIGSSSSRHVDRLYFGTEVRAGELLIGALVGLWWVPRRERPIPGISTLGPILLALMLVLIGTARHQDLVWYRGGLLGYALVTSGVVLAAIASRGIVRALLSWAPLVAIGVVSYGAYLVHWPVFLWLNTGTSLPGAARLVLGTTISIAVAAVSYSLIERPIRERRLLGDPVLVGLGVGLVGVVMLVSGIVAPRLADSRHQVALADTRNRYEESLAKSQAGPGEAPTVAVFGDSTALVTSVGLTIWDDTHSDVRMVEGWANLGCSITSPGEVRSQGKSSPTPEQCVDWLDEWRATVGKTSPDIAFVQFGPWEVYELKPAGISDFHVIGHAELDAIMARNLAAGLEVLLAGSRIVAVATSPYIERGRLNGRSPERAFPESERSRMDRLNQIIRDVARRYERVAVIDLAGFIAAREDDARLRPDGVHFTADTAVELSGLLGPTLASLAPGAEPSLAERPGLLPVLQRSKR